MCILFMYQGHEDADSDYSLILISNRNEFYDRPSRDLAFWEEDTNVIGGRDLEPGCNEGSWLAISPLRKKIGVLLNLPSDAKQNAQSRGKIVADYVKCDKSTDDYIKSIQHYVAACNGFVFVTIEFGPTLAVKTYTNATNQLDLWTDPYLGFSNHLPKSPLKKVDVGKNMLKEICDKYKKVEMKAELINELITLLKSSSSHLPDPQLEERRPYTYKELSSIFVSIPQGRYGTRTHTIVLISKNGIMNLIEINMQAPIDPDNPKWKKSDYELQVKLDSC